MSGILYGVGVGPGDPELLTLKALNKIKMSQTIILPVAHKKECHAYNIVAGIYPEIEGKEIICLPFPMIKDKEILKKAHDEIFKAVKEELESGKKVSFLTIGDPTIYSTYMYLHQRMVKEGYEAYIINGIPSFCAAAGVLNIPLGENKEEIHIIPGSYDVEEAILLKGTKIFMKSGKQLIKLKEALLELEKSHKYSIYGISNCGMENEIVYKRLQDIGEDSGYLTIVIVKENN
ncbi:precorrin-2/cobalt-factor-2 C20-methyltransferase [Mobilisporobacter senegalensis]|uniref:Precorrin-2/cobalt-factor-2 C20-methyltransferase n=1 Tax=Mobilisporobacter senegalensis TaxID=1329262 RepID=A0A3N1XTX1_9FIRM|nr:precorrin-2 C(20)-methyltransferase [Mobilisporobacter senegalensis]ROR28317.1 precorrin-2/cobalt-factor-2 C20-methyltransferase [Mobilisporobacter senegalensis]